MGETSGSKTQIIVALIALVGVIATALFTNWDRIFPPAQTDNIKERGTREKPLRDSEATRERSTSIPITLDSHGAQATARVGESQISEYNRADILISVYDNKTGTSISSLAQKGHLGNGRSVIPLPTGWNLHTKLVPAGGCTLQPTHIYNDGKGSYTLSVMTVATKGACPWKKGEYHYLLEINLNQYKGRSIGQIIIK